MSYNESLYAKKAPKGTPPPPSQIPTVFDGTDLYSRLLQDRIILLGKTLDDELSNSIIAQLVHLASEDPAKDISLYINTPGGKVTAGLAIYDMMQHLECDVATFCMGEAASMGAMLLALGAPGKRYALPHSRVMIHQPLAEFDGQATDIRIHARETQRIREVLDDLLAAHTGQPVERIRRDTERDNFMTADEAKEYGLIDEVLAPAKRKLSTRRPATEPEASD